MSGYLLALLAVLHTSAAWAQTCTREYAPVCGQQHSTSQPQTFANLCLMSAAEASFVSPGECAALPETMAGGDTDADGCQGSAGHVWNPEIEACVRPWLSQVITLEVAGHRQACEGLIPMQCLVVREHGCEQANPTWTAFYDHIEGFNHEPGQHYTLRVRKDKRDNPPADASDTTYTLLHILKTAPSAGRPLK
jgi:hypothetical protein